MAIIRRVPPLLLWVVLSAFWMAFLRIFEPGSKAFEYFQTPIFIGVMIIAAQVVPGKHRSWLPPLIGLLVTVPFVLVGKALS